MLPAARRALARAVYETGTLVAPYPHLALPIARWRGHGEVVGPESDILIEGYPRSGNTFAVAALSHVRPGVRIAHHLHAPGHVIAAIRLGVPALVLIRDPEQAVAELVLLKPALTVAQALRGYVRFYAPLLPHRAGFVVARTSEVTADFGAVTRRVNERFGTAFPPFEPTEENVAAAHRRIGEYWASRPGPGLPLVGRTAGAEEDRDADRERLRRAFRSTGLSKLRTRALGLHETFTRGAPEGPGAAETRL